MAMNSHATSRAAKQTAAAILEQSESPVSSKGQEMQGWKGELFRRQFMKTTLCRFHAMGKCSKGKSCPFAHEPSELSVAPDLRKTSVCAAWMVGECLKSSKHCQFAHGAQELRMTPLFKVSLPVRPVRCGRASPTGGTSMQNDAGRNEGFNGSINVDMFSGQSNRGDRALAMGLPLSRMTNKRGPQKGSFASSSFTNSTDLGTLTGSCDLDEFTASSEFADMRTPSTDEDSNEFDCDTCLEDPPQPFQDRPHFRHVILPQPRQDRRDVSQQQPRQACTQQPRQDCAQQQQPRQDCPNQQPRQDSAQQQAREDCAEQRPRAADWIETTAQYLLTAPMGERDMLAAMLKESAPQYYED